ncbi:MAG: Clp protease N-terminal domain-containing protein, partial [bacterium]
MNLKRYTEKAQEAVLAAQQLAERSGHPEIDPEHLLRALVDQQDGVVPSVLRQLGAEPTRLLVDVDTALGRRPQARGGSE